MVINKDISSSTCYVSHGVLPHAFDPRQPPATKRPFVTMLDQPYTHKVFRRRRTNLPFDFSWVDWAVGWTHFVRRAVQYHLESCREKNCPRRICSSHNAPFGTARRWILQFLHQKRWMDCLSSMSFPSAYMFCHHILLIYAWTHLLQAGIHKFAFSSSLDPLPLLVVFGLTCYARLVPRSKIHLPLIWSKLLVCQSQLSSAVYKTHTFHRSDILCRSLLWVCRRFSSACYCRQTLSLEIYYLSLTHACLCWHVCILILHIVICCVVSSSSYLDACVHKSWPCRCFISSSNCLVILSPYIDPCINVSPAYQYFISLSVFSYIIGVFLTSFRKHHYALRRSAWVRWVV